MVAADGRRAKRSRAVAALPGSRSYDADPMRSRLSRALAVAGLGVLVAGFILLRTHPSSRAPARRDTGFPEGVEHAPPGTSASLPPEEVGALPLLAALQAALEHGGGAPAQDAAAALRRLVRTDEAALRAAQKELLAAGTPRDVRMALALVLGTLPGSDDVLLEAARRFAEDAEFVRCALLALGATREPEDEDEIFDLGDRPWGERGPLGLGITVRRSIDDARVRSSVASWLEDDAIAVRRAAAVALRQSLAAADTRDAFLSQLEREESDEVASVVGEALARRAGEEGDAARAAIVGVLLRRAADEGFDGYRFRLEDDLGSVALTPSERMALLDLARAPHPFGVRSFALSALGAGAPRWGAEAVTEARRLFEAFLREDADDAVRDIAARLLGKLPADDGSVALLARAASADAAWRVRYSAVEALAASGPTATVLAALKAAAADADERVAARARELARRLEARPPR